MRELFTVLRKPRWPVGRLAGWPVGRLIGLLVITALVTGGGTNPDCDDRAVVWGQDSNYETHLLSKTVTETTDVLPAATGPTRARWYGDDQARLLLYSWGSEHSGVAFSSLKSHAKSVRAVEYNWPSSVNGGDHREWPVGQPCTNGVCGEWKSARNVDIGFCSLEIPHTPRETWMWSPFLNASGLHDVSFATEVVETLSEQLDEQMYAGEGCPFGDCDVYTRLRSSDPITWWVSTDHRENEICFRVPFEARVVKGVNCPYRGIQVSFCGVVNANTRGELRWDNTRTHYSRYINVSAPICNRARKTVAEAVLARITRLDSDPDGPNEITAALRSQMDAFSLTPEVLDPNAENPFMQHNCTNPAVFPGNRNIYCEAGAANTLRGNCVSKPGGGGECRYFASVARVEMMPSGMELILAEQGPGESSVLNKLINEYDGDDPLLLGLKGYHCAAADGLPVNTLSRRYDRITRGSRAVAFDTPHNTTLD